MQKEQYWGQVGILYCKLTLQKFSQTWSSYTSCVDSFNSVFITIITSWWPDQPLGCYGYALYYWVYMCNYKD
jgi:hypothetical protein